VTACAPKVAGHTPLIRGQADPDRRDQQGSKDRKRRVSRSPDALPDTGELFPPWQVRVFAKPSERPVISHASGHLLARGQLGAAGDSTTGTTTFRWSAQEVCDLVRAVEHLTKDGDAGWERGGLGQCLWSLLIEDPDLRSAVLPAIGLALNVEDLEAAFQLLVIHQYLAEDPLVAARESIALHPGVREHVYTRELLQQIAEFGFVDVY
jgi:hypothetical protein